MWVIVSTIHLKTNSEYIRHDSVVLSCSYLQLSLNPPPSFRSHWSSSPMGVFSRDYGLHILKVAYEVIWIDIAVIILRLFAVCEQKVLLLHGMHAHARFSGRLIGTTCMYIISMHDPLHAMGNLFLFPVHAFPVAPLFSSCSRRWWLEMIEAPSLVICLFWSDTCNDQVTAHHDFLRQNTN